MSKVLSGECLVREPLVLDKPATNFIADAYYRGDRITVKLSNLAEMWVILFFYKADFTFV